MPSPSRSTFTMPMSAQSSLSHCTTTRPGHRRRLERHHGIELPLADDHPAGMLPQMARQILHHARTSSKNLRIRGCCRIEPRIAKLPLQRVVRVLVFPRAHQARQAVERFRIERQRLADFARRRAPAIGDDVRRHRRAQLPVALVHILNRALALIAAGQIEIDVRPFAALFG